MQIVSLTSAEIGQMHTKATGKKGPSVDDFSQFDIVRNILLVCAA